MYAMLSLPLTLNTLYIEVLTHDCKLCNVFLLHPIASMPYNKVLSEIDLSKNTVCNSELLFLVLENIQLKLR